MRGQTFTFLTHDPNVQKPEQRKDILGPQKFQGSDAISAICYAGLDQQNVRTTAT